MADDLKSELTAHLASDGTLNQLKSTLRSKLYTILSSTSPSPTASTTLSDENLLINELIREYLQYNNYGHTLSVFVSESNQPDPFPRDFLKRRLGVTEDSHESSVSNPL